MQEPQIDTLLLAFSAQRFYLSRSAMVEAVQTGRMFNLLDLESGDKVDFWILTNSPFDQARFQRRLPVQIRGHNLWVSSPEDTILMKLKWAIASGGSEKQFVDALRVYEIQSSILDLHYIEYWLDNLAVRPLWDRLTREAEPLA